VVVCYILWPFVIFCGRLLYFPHFGTLNQEKSGNPVSDPSILVHYIKKNMATLTLDFSFHDNMSTTSVQPSNPRGDGSLTETATATRRSGRVSSGKNEEATVVQDSKFDDSAGKTENAFSKVLYSSELCTRGSSSQGDQIARIFANLSIIYLLWEAF
jgi:hypothetical protein